MSDFNLQQALWESRLRYENKLAALKLGLFGKTMPEIAENTHIYESNLKYKVDSVCQQLATKTSV